MCGCQCCHTDTSLNFTPFLSVNTCTYSFKRQQYVMSEMNREFWNESVLCLEAELLLAALLKQHVPLSLFLFLVVTLYTLLYTTMQVLYSFGMLINLMSSSWIQE